MKGADSRTELNRVQSVLNTLNAYNSIVKNGKDTIVKNLDTILTILKFYEDATRIIVEYPAFKELEDFATLLSDDDFKTLFSITSILNSITGKLDQAELECGDKLKDVIKEIEVEESK